jgi:N-acetylmuramic acid 6-phosphate etherase
MDANIPPTSPDRGDLPTERRLSSSVALDAVPTVQMLRLINEQDATVHQAVERAIPAIASFIEAFAGNAARGGRLIYLGAGTSGRLAVLDASECPPTFHCDPSSVIGIIAGGDGALRKSSEGMEDDPLGSHEALAALNLTRDDAVVGIAAGGTTPYVWGAIDFARERQCVTALMCCVSLEQARRHRPPGAPLPEHVIELITGPEVLTGSTRMKAGTATKLALNMISTGVMVRQGKTWGNLMVDVRATNAKLRDRAARIIQSQTTLSRNEALTLLHIADGRVKVALIMALRAVDAPTAKKMLESHNNRLRPILGDPC